MKIKAKSKLNFKTIRALARAEVFRKSDPLKKMLLYCLVALLLAAVLLLEMHLLGASALPIILFIVAILLFAFELFLYFGLPRIRYKALGELRGCTNEFCFTDDSILLKAYDNGYSGESRVDYKVLTRAVETKKYLYIYQTKAQVYIVDKTSLAEGEPEQLRQKLQGILTERYVVYKY